MASEQSWSSFHDKYASEGYRRSTEFDHGNGKGVVRTLLKRCSSRKLIVPEEHVRPTLSRSMSSKISSRNLLDEISYGSKRRPSLSTVSRPPKPMRNSISAMTA